MTAHEHVRRPYYWVFAILIGLTLLTVGVAFLDLGPFNTVMALGIASTKAMLVIFYFMHLRQSNALTRLVMGAGVFWLALLISWTLSDYLTRGWYTVKGW